MADNLTGIDSAQDDVMDVLSSPQKMRALLERARQAVPSQSNNAQFNAELLGSFNDWSRDVAQGSDPVKSWNDNVQTTLDKWQKGAAQQASKALETTATRFFSDPSSASQKDADVLLASPFRAEVVSVLNKSRKTPAEGSTGHYTGHADQPGSPNDSVELPGENYRAYANAHNEWSKNVPPATILVPGKLYGKNEVPNPQFAAFIEKNPEPKLRDFLGRLPNSASAALAPRPGLPNLQSTPASSAPPLPSASGQAFGQQYTDPNSGQIVSYMGPTGGIQTAEQAAAILSGKSPQLVLGNSKSTGTGTSAASALQKAESGLPDFGPVKSSRTKIRDKKTGKTYIYRGNPDDVPTDKYDVLQ